MENAIFNRLKLNKHNYRNRELFYVEDYFQNHTFCTLAIILFSTGSTVNQYDYFFSID